jgi:Ca2+-binding EF-hand superfamily protein
MIAILLVLVCLVEFKYSDTMKQMLTEYGTEDKRLTCDEADDLLLSFPELKRGTFDWEKFLKSIL